MKKKPASARPRFPEDEKRLPWLSLLLDAYAIVDRGLAAAVAREERNRKARLACGRGCDVCCRAQKDIPVYPLELVGIYWYAIEKLREPLRQGLKARLAAFRNEDACPFLIERECVIHPFRPIACRQFNVFGASCAEGEDPYFTRRDDLLFPPQDITDTAFRKMLPFYGYHDEKTIDEVIRSRLIHAEARVLQSLRWNELGMRMDEYEAGKEKK